MFFFFLMTRNSPRFAFTPGSSDDHRQTPKTQHHSQALCIGYILMLTRTGDLQEQIKCLDRSNNIKVGNKNSCAWGFWSSKQRGQTCDFFLLKIFTLSLLSLSLHPKFFADFISEMLKAWVVKHENVDLSLGSSHLVQKAGGLANLYHVHPS